MKGTIKRISETRIIHDPAEKNRSVRFFVNYISPYSGFPKRPHGRMIKITIMSIKGNAKANLGMM